MSQLPADMSPEAAAWLHTQIVIHNARTAAVLRAEISKVDNWANSIFAALRDLMGHALFELPALRAPIDKDWVCDAQDFARASQGERPVHNPAATAEELEARAMLHRYFVRLGVFKAPGQG